jgi:aryl-alcohol dehydrogenase-like predicted oxidoreductase
VTVATKVLPPYSAASIELSVRQSLERLQIDAIDLLYLHRWDATVADPETLAALNAQVRGGRVRAFAASNFDNAQLEDLLNRCDREGLSGPHALQNVNNLALRSIDATTRRLCSERDIAIVTYSPLGAGFLTGKYSESIPAGSRFAVIPGHQPLYFTPTGRARLERLQAIALRVGLPTADLALAWALHQPQVATVLVGGRCRAQLDRAAQAQSLDFPEVFAALEADVE